MVMDVDTLAVVTKALVNLGKDLLPIIVFLPEGARLVHLGGRIGSLDAALGLVPSWALRSRGGCAGARGSLGRIRSHIRNSGNPQVILVGRRFAEGIGD